MARTPDRQPGENLEEGTVYQNVTSDPPVAGGVRYVSGSFRLRDQFGVFNPRNSGSFSQPTSTSVGQIIICVDGINFEARQPIVSLSSGWVINNSGTLIVN